MSELHAEEKNRNNHNAATFNMQNYRIRRVMVTQRETMKPTSYI